MSWCDIPIELLSEIIKRVDVFDLVRSEAVCSWWRQCNLLHRDYLRNYVRKSQTPLLMLSSSDNDKIQSRYFYYFVENRTYEFRLPEIAGRHCIGSSHGYLFTNDRNADLIATNPLAGGIPRLSLPPTSKLPKVVGVVKDDSTGRITAYKIQRYARIGTSSVEHVHKMFYRKAILSPDRDVVVAIQGFDCLLAFAYVGDQSWTALETQELEDFDDMIFHKGRLHAINFMGTLAIFDLNRPSDPPFLSPMGPLGSENGAPRRYLVESPHGDDLFLVYKDYEYVTEQEIPRTNDFKVYILDKETYTWKQIKTLGNVSLFLGFNYSMSLCAREFPGIRSNCIFFTDDYKSCYINSPEKAGDKGVFNLEEARVEPLYTDSNLNRLDWPPPVWFMPALS